MTRAVQDVPRPEVPDLASRRQALDPARSSIVQAPAGSGKTELLIQRYLTLLARVRIPESIVALTFTRKAAGEMRHRVLAALAGASGPEPSTSHERETWRLSRTALARDQDGGWRLLEHPSRLRIQTIDSLCAGLVRRMPWVSRMGAPPEPDENVGYLYRRAARRTIGCLGSADPLAGAVSRVLAHLDNDVATAEALLAGMLRDRDQWLRHVVGRPAPSELRRGFEAALRQIIQDALAGLAPSFSPSARVAILECARYAARNLLERSIENPLAACADLEEWPSPDPEGLRCWLGLREMLLTRDGRRRRAHGIRQGFPPTAEGRCFKASLQAIELDDVLLARLDRVGSLPPPLPGDEEWRILESLLDLLPMAVAHLKLVFRAEGRVDFTEIAHAARTALGPPDAPTDLAFALDCRIEHILVDEFQDTSQSQFELLQSLTADWQPGDGRTLFVVGDPMQSIYGFREADVALFLQARRQGVGRVRLTPLTLSANFRSTPEVVDWINRAFGPAFPPAENMLTGEVPYERSVAFGSGTIRQDQAGPAGVKVHAFPLYDAEREAERVLGIVQETREQFPEGTIGVLVRARGHLARTIAAFRREGIRFQAVEIDALGTRPAVQDLLTLTRALLDPADRVSWLAILRAPWCGLTLADLERLIREDASSAVWDLVCDRVAGARSGGFQGLSADGARRLGRLAGVLEDAFSRRGRMGLRRWVEATWLALGGPACLDGPTDLEHALAFLDLLDSAAPGAWIGDEGRFLEEVAGLFARPDVGAAGEASPVTLQLLTIHKAKGLEFDTVILPGLGRVTRAGRSGLMRWLEYVDGRGTSQLLLAPIRETGTGESRLSGYLDRLAAARREHESTRLLYVAATRARSRLHLLGHTRLLPGGAGLRPPDPRSLMGKIWQAVEAVFQEALDGGHAQQTSGPLRSPEAAQGVPLRRLGPSWRMPQPPEGFPSLRRSDPQPPGWGEEHTEVPQPAFDWAGDLQRRVGIVVHGLLQRLSVTARSPGQSPWRQWGDGTIRAALAAEGVSLGKLEEAERLVETALHNTLEDERGRWILRSHEEDRREFPLSRVVAGSVRRYVLDRTFVEAGVRWIIDYKTGAHEGAARDAFLDNEVERYRAQLEAYARAVRPLDPRPIRLGLYFPLLRGWREWSFE